MALGIAAATGLWARVGGRRLAAVALAATLLTHPFAWHGFAALKGLVPGYWPRALIIEGGVAVVEGLLYGSLAGAGLWRGQLMGWAANAWSYGLGLLILEAFYR